MLQPKGSPNGICPLPWGWLKVIAHYRSSILRIVKESFTKWSGTAGRGVHLEFETGARPPEVDGLPVSEITGAVREQI
jgi:hypothetical protein